jgi:hypothetical protein
LGLDIKSLNSLTLEVAFLTTEILKGIINIKNLIPLLFKICDIIFNSSKIFLNACPCRSRVQKVSQII